MWSSSQDGWQYNGHTKRQVLYFLLSYLFCTIAQPGLSKLLFNINFVEGRPNLVSDLNTVAAILAARLANDVGSIFFCCSGGALGV